MSDRYEVVQLANGEFSLRSHAYGETFHPVIGPVAEAQALYVDQLRLVERVSEAKAEFVVWDVGLGAAANSLVFIRAIQHLGRAVRVVSFDRTIEPLQFALGHADRLRYLRGWKEPLSQLLEAQTIQLDTAGGGTIAWELHLADFPTFVRSRAAAAIPKPDAIFYDAFSPATNPAMWTLPVFSDLFGLLDPGRLCLMPTYSRSTMLRVTLLLAGFFVGKGHASGEKEETTIASNHPEALAEPLDRSWLPRARRSRGAEPLRTDTYKQAPLAEASWEQLLRHPQFAPPR